MPNRTPITLVACLLIGACDCEDGRTPSRNAQTPAASTSSGEGARPNLPPPEGTPVEPNALTRFAPETLAGGFTASGDVQTRSSQLPNGGKLPGIRREYKHDRQKLMLDITDSLHAGTVRELVLSQQGQERKTARSVFEGKPVGGQPALVQFHEPTETAIVNMVVGDRYAVNVKVSPVSSAEPALAVASGLALAELAQVDADNPAAAKPQPAPAAAPTNAPAEPAPPPK